MPTAAVVVAHPDDEAVGAGSRLLRLRRATLVHVTDGAPRDLTDARAAGFSSREAYARVRRDELHAALELVGIPREQARPIGCVDQDAVRHLPTLARRLAEILGELRPRMVLTHSYEGGHPDHDATAFAVHAAVELVRREGLAPPAIVEMALYHHRDGRMAVHEFLPAPDGAARTVTLSRAERAFKRRLLACYRSQRAMLQQFPVALERFRLAPRHDFTRPPHPGPLLYELLPWGITGMRFRELATAARAELGLEDVR